MKLEKQNRLNRHKIKNMQKPIAIFALLLILMQAFAQDTTVQKKFVDVSISLAGLGGDYITNSLGIQAGIEFRLKNNVGMQCDLRYIFNIPRYKGGSLYVDVDELSGFAVNTEFKVYLRQFKNELRGGYVGGQLLFLYTVGFQEEYRISRNKTGLYGIVGWKYISKSGFLFETSAGIGAQLISSNSTNSPPDGYFHSTEFPWSKPYDSGTYICPDFIWNIRIGWRF